MRTANVSLYAAKEACILLLVPQPSWSRILSSNNDAPVRCRMTGYALNRANHTGPSALEACTRIGNRGSYTDQATHYSLGTGCCRQQFVLKHIRRHQLGNGGEDGSWPGLVSLSVGEVASARFCVAWAPESTAGKVVGLPSKLVQVVGGLVGLRDHAVLEALNSSIELKDRPRGPCRRRRRLADPLCIPKLLYLRDTPDRLTRDYCVISRDTGKNGTLRRPWNHLWLRGAWLAEEFLSPPTSLVLSTPLRAGTAQRSPLLDDLRFLGAKHTV